MQLLHRHSARRSRRRPDAFTIVEALIALTVLIIFAVSSTVTLNLFNDRAAKNRNTEAARALMENYVSQTLATKIKLTPTTATATVNGIPVDVCNAIGTGGVAVPQPIALIVGRNSSATPVVTGNLYWRVQNVGTTYGATSNTDLVQVDFVIQYTYRNKPYYYNVMTFKANS